MTLEHNGQHQGLPTLESCCLFPSNKERRTRKKCCISALVFAAAVCLSSSTCTLAFDLANRNPQQPPRRASSTVRQYAMDTILSRPEQIALSSRIQFQPKPTTTRKQGVVDKKKTVRRRVSGRVPLDDARILPAGGTKGPTSKNMAPVVARTSMRRSSQRYVLIQSHTKLALDAAEQQQSSELSLTEDPEKLLTKEDETRYSFALRSMRMVIRMRDALVKHDLNTDMYIHPTEERWAAACGFVHVDQLRYVMQQGQEARSILCSANVGLVTSIAKRHYASLKSASDAGNGSVGTILTLHDMIQEGNLGLMEAAERFEPEKGFRFSTYAVWWIRQRILRSVRDSSRTIRLPAHVHGMLQKIRRARIELQQEFNKAPTMAQVAEKLGVTEQKLLRYTMSSRNVVSLEVPVVTTRTFKQDFRTLGETLASDAPTPDEDVEAEYLRRDVWHVMRTELTDLERQVIMHRFGFMTGKTREPSGQPQTVAQTAISLNLSRDRVRLVEARALNKLRHPQKNYRLKDYVIAGDSARTGLVKQRRNMRAVRSNNHSSDQPTKIVVAKSLSAETKMSSSQTDTSASPRPDRMWFF